MTTSKTEQLAAMRSQAHDAVKRVTELEAERLKAQRSVERVKAPLRDYFEQLGAGEIEPDPKTERKLREAVARAESVVSMRPRLTGGHVTDFEVVDDQIEAQLAGARRAAEQRHADVRGFIDEHRAELLAERFPAWQETGRRYGAAIEELLEADGERAHAIRECIELGVPTEELPPRLFPLDPQAVGDYRATRQRDPGSLVPAPRWLTSDEEAT